MLSVSSGLYSMSYFEDVSSTLLRNISTVYQITRSHILQDINITYLFIEKKFQTSQILIWFKIWSCGRGFVNTVKGLEFHRKCGISWPVNEHYLLIVVCVQTHKHTYMTKDKAIPVQAWTGPESSRRLGLPECLDNRHMKVVRLAAIRTGRLCSSRNIPGTLFC
jgi:hypothetical protein